MRIRVYNQRCERESNIDLETEAKSVAKIMISFSFSYLLRFIWDIGVFAHLEDGYPFVALLGFVYLPLFFDLIPLTWLMMFHKKNF